MSTVNILVAVYNGEKYLDPLLQSLLDQDYPDIKISIRDNCSKDNTHQKIKDWQNRFPQKIYPILSKENVGIIGNFSTLLSQSKETYIMFCDHDDVWLPNKVSKTMAKMKELEAAYGTRAPLLVHTDLTVVDKNLQLIAPSFWKYSHLNTSESCHTFPRLLVQNHITGCTMMINRELINLASPIPPDCVMHDWWIALVASCFGHIGAVKEPTILYRQHGGNDTGAKRYSILSTLKKMLPWNSRYGKTAPNKTLQTKLFLDRYGHFMPEQYGRIALSYLDMQEAALPRKLALMIRNGLFKSGIIRNFILDH